MVRPAGNAYSPPSEIQTQSTEAATDKSETKDPSTASQEPEVGSFAKTPQPLRQKADLEVESKKRSEDLDKELRKYGDKSGKKSQEVKIEEPPDHTFKDVDGLKSPETALDKQHYKKTITSMFKADVAGTPKGLFMKNYENASPKQKEEMANALQGALADR